MPSRRPHRRHMLLAGLAGACAPRLSGLAGDLPPALEPLRQQALQFTTSGAAPSLSVAVIQRGVPIWVEAFGWADRERQIPASVSTPYAIASASKPFTATAIAALAAAGAIDLSQPIQRYVSGAATARLDPSTSVRELLQHRSGIPRHWRNHFRGQAAPAAFAEVARVHAFTTPARGARYLYSNMNYGLLASALEIFAGRTLHQHLHDTIFRPLGLTSATFLQTQFDAWSAAVPYEEDGTPIQPYLADETGARDLIMTALDLAKFGAAHAGSAIGVTNSMLSDKSDLAIEGVGRSSYGLGWMIEEESPAALFNYGHTGEGPGAASSLTIVPAENLVVATIANAQGPPAYRLNSAIIEALSPAFAALRRAHPFQEEALAPGDHTPFIGEWTGKITLSQDEPEVQLDIASAEQARIVLNGQTQTLTRVVLSGGILSARATFQLPSPETEQWPHQLRLSLELKNGGLEGVVAAYAARDPAPHDQFWLSHRISLIRKPT